VRVLDHGTTEEGCPYLVLEFLEGESLEERRVRMGGRLQIREVLDICEALLAVLEVAHAKSIVHRDIKPSNLFMMKSGQLKVLDFGIARITDDTSSTSTKTGTMVGTPAFMPPEQALSRPREVDARTDIWSVGATLFTLLSGEHVHIAETSSEHLVKAATLHARSLAKALPGTPSNVEAFVARCLAFDKSQRWASAKTMREELAYVREDPGRRIGTSTSPPPERSPSDPNVATFVTGETPGSFRAPPPPSSKGSGELDANMALASDPGTTYDLMRSRRRWVVPAVVAGGFLVVMGAIALGFAVRGPGETTAAAPATQQRAVAGSPPPAVSTLAVAAVESAAKSGESHPAPSSIASASAGARGNGIATSAIRPQPAKTSAVPAKKSPATPTASNRDLYRPF
jgi:serine/threonine-protein kinase